jgi:hypothetical protein
MAARHERRLSPKRARKKEARLCLVAPPFETVKEEAYFFFIPAFAMLSFIRLSFIIESFIAVESVIFMAEVSVAAGAGAIAAPVSTGVSSFFEHAASTRTAATRAMRFIEKSP